MSEEKKENWNLIPEGNKEKTYKVQLKCYNCGFFHGWNNTDWEVEIEKGTPLHHKYPEIACPHCGCVDWGGRLGE